MISMDLKTDLFSKIADDAIRPMSIRSIKEKFNLSFPFQVKRVKDSYSYGSWKGITTITALEYAKAGGVMKWGTNNVRFINGKRYRQCAEVEDYILFEK